MSCADDGVMQCSANSIHNVDELEEVNESMVVDNTSESAFHLFISDSMSSFLSSSKYFLLELEQLTKRYVVSDTRSILVLLIVCSVICIILYRSCITLERFSRRKKCKSTDRSEKMIKNESRRGLLHYRAKSQPNLNQMQNDELDLYNPIDNEDTNDDSSLYISRKRSFSYSCSPSSDWDFQTEEERFERLWPAQSKFRSKYSKLVLPPSCRRIASLVSSTPSSVNGIKSTSKINLNHIKNDEDNPAKRIQNYFAQICAFVRSMLLYDYNGAGRILTYWLQAWQNIREYRQKSFRSSLSDDKDLDVVKQGSENLEVKKCNDDTGANNIRNELDSTTAREVDISSSSWNIEKEDETKISSYFVEEKKELSGNEVTEDYLDFGNKTLHAQIRKHVSRSTSLGHCDSNSMRKLSQEDSFRSVDPNNNDFSFTSRDGSCSLLHDMKISHDSPHEWEDIPQVHSDTDCANEKKVSGPLHLQSGDTSIENDRGSLTPTRNNKVFRGSDEQRLTTVHATPLRRWISSKHRNDPKQQSLTHFFDTADSQESMRQQSIDVVIPDKSGYILSEHFLLDPRNDTPLLVFVNSRSGPQQGHILITQLRRLLNPIQVWDLADGGPESILESFSIFTRLRILVCGGDGTVAWIISALEKRDADKQKHEYPTNRIDNCDKDVQNALQNTDGEMSNVDVNTYQEKKPLRRWPPIAILPLGTGNDLARMHGWGGGYNNESLITILEQISESYASLLDRWEVTISDTKNKKSQTKNFFNYLGVGADAQAALQVHNLRESRPDWFFSRLVNKALYGLFGAEDIIKSSSVNTRKNIKLIADGIEIPLPPDSQGIIILNIDAYAGGVPLWSHATKPIAHSSSDQTLNVTRLRRRRSLTEFESIDARGSNSLVPRKDRNRNRVDSSDDLLDSLSYEERVTACDLPASCQDGILEIVSIRGAFHLGQIKVGLSNAHRLCQCREVTIMVKNTVAVQVDGEPWRQPSCKLTIKRKKEQAVMLHRSADDGGVEMEMSKLLDWAEERKMIDSQVHLILMKEFSRRIESKNRQRRVRGKDNNIMSTLKKAISSGAMSNSMSNIPSSQNQWPMTGLSF